MRLRTPSKAAGAAAVALTLGLTVGGCRGNTSSEPPVHLNPNMDHQQKFTAQDRSDFYDDGRAMREPPAGTVARSVAGGADDRFLRDDDHLYRGRGADGRLTDALPAGMQLDAKLLARGQRQFNIYCAPCHSETGLGDGIVIQRGFKVQPPTFHSDQLRAMPLGHFYDVITNGVRTMMPYASQVAPEDRWAIAAWIRVLQASHNATLADVPPEVATQKGWSAR